jgi:hypothetical protein
MSRVSAATKEAASGKDISQDSARSSTTVIEHVLSRLKGIGISKVFGVAGDFAFPIEDAIGRDPGIEWVGCSNELNAAYAADGYGRIHGIAALDTTYALIRRSFIAWLGNRRECRLEFYIPVAHWIWSGGFLAKLGVVDFAGGLVIHTTAGLSALTVAKLLGPRRDEERSIPAANIPLVAVGAGLLWFGWFGFNSGGAYAANTLAAYAFVNTTLSGSAGLLVWQF